MALLRMLKSLVNKRLTVAAEEIFWSVGRILTEYEDEALGLKQDIERKRRLLDMILNPEIKLHRAETLHLPLCKEVPPEQHVGNSSLVQDEPEPPQIKEEQDVLLQRPEEVLTLLAVKSEDDGENKVTESVATNLNEHMKTQAKDFGTSQPAIDDELLSSHCSESDTEDSDDWEEKREDLSGLMKSHKTQDVDGQIVSLSNKSSRNLKSSKQTHSMSSHTGKKGFSCTVCGQHFSQKGHLTVHARIHTGDKPFTCKVCGKGFAESGTLKRHMMIHTREKLFTCKVCGKGFGQNGKLKQHMMIHTGGKPVTCTVCNKGFGQKGELKIHMMSHTGEKLFTCKVCGKGFGQSGDLKRHLMIHTGERPFTCKVCGKGFGQNGKLKQHMMIHTGEKPVTCTVCNKGFGQKGELKIHMMSHTGEKLFSCKVCGKGFGQSGDLKRHMMIHTGERPFTCTVCGKGFNAKGNLKKHTRTHTGE